MIFQKVTLEDVKHITQSINYVLYHRVDKGAYVGLSTSGGVRIKQHFTNLSANRHINKALQEAYNTLGNNIDIFIYMCDKDVELYDNEIFIIQHIEHVVGIKCKIYNNMGAKYIIPFIKQGRFKKIFQKITINKEGCWIYGGVLSRDGYCRLRINKKSLSIHRVVYTMFKRTELKNIEWNIPNNLLIRHICHNKRCCNPEHLLLGTDKDNVQDSIGRIKRKPSRCGRLITAWGETKSTGAWMIDPRRHPDVQGSTLLSRFKRKNISPEEALTKPLSKIGHRLNEKERQDRINKKLIKENENKKKFALASTIRQLYEQGEHIDDLLKYFDISRPNILLIINNKKWYNPSVVGKIPEDYIRKKRRLPPPGVKISGRGYCDKFPYGRDEKYGIYWQCGYFGGHIYIKCNNKRKCINIGKFDTAEEAARKINNIYVEHGYEPLYRFE